MATYTITNTFTADTTAVASEVNQNFTDVLTALNAFDAGNLASGTVPITRISGLTVSQIAAATLVTEAEGIDSSDNDTSWPTTAAVKDAVDAKEDTIVTQATASIFGSWTDKDSGGSNALALNEVYKVGSDGFVKVVDVTNSNTITGFTDGSNPPTTARDYEKQGFGAPASLTLPVRKGDYWKITCNDAITAIYWLPVGTGKSVKQ